MDLKEAFEEDGPLARSPHGTAGQFWWLYGSSPAAHGIFFIWEHQEPKLNVFCLNRFNFSCQGRMATDTAGC